MKESIPSQPAVSLPKLISLPRPKPGRPTLYTPEVEAEICAAIRLHGVSDSMAGLLAGVSTSTTSRWLREIEEFAIATGQARAQYEVERLIKIGETRKRDGSLDWRAQAWLLQHSSPETYGLPSRRKKREPAKEPAPAAEATPGRMVVTPVDLEKLQAARARALARMPSGEEAARADADETILPETPGQPAQTPDRLGQLGRRLAQGATTFISGLAATKPAVSIPKTSAVLPKTPAAATAAATDRANSRRRAEEAESFRRIHQAMDREWLRQADAPREDWMHDVIPGMWAGG